MKNWSVRGVTAVLTVVVLANGIRAEDLGFPESCVELANVPPKGLNSYTLSPRDSVLLAFDHPNRKHIPGELSPFIAWDSRTGKWLAKLSAPEEHALNWKFSPDGTLLAIGIATRTRVVQLWEVGAKDNQGVPALRLIAKLPQRNPRPILPGATPRQEGHASFADVVGLIWAPDSKTLLAKHWSPNGSEIQFWSRTDKPSVWDESDRDTKWKPWAILEFGHLDQFHFAVSPDNRSLAVINNSLGLRAGGGKIFDLNTAELREEFQLKRQTKKPRGDYRLQYSGDGKTLAISDYQYLSLWDTSPLAPRVAMENPDFLGESDHPHYHTAFIHDDRWLLTVKSASREDRRRLTGGLNQLQYRDAQSGELRKEVAFPKELGLLDALETLLDGRVMTRFAFRKKKQDFGERYFLWAHADLLRYAAEHGSAPMAKFKAD